MSTTSTTNNKEAKTPPPSPVSASPVSRDKMHSGSPKTKTPELHFNYKKPRQYHTQPRVLTPKNMDDDQTLRKSRGRQRRKSDSVGNNGKIIHMFLLRWLLVLFDI